MTPTEAGRPPVRWALIDRILFVVTMLAVVLCVTAVLLNRGSALPASRTEARAGTATSGVPSGLALEMLMPKSLVGHCSGAQLAGTRLVVTAAHCLANQLGEITTVVNGAVLHARRVWIHPEYRTDGVSPLDARNIHVDVAVVEFPMMNRTAPGAVYRPGKVGPHAALAVHAHQFTEGDRNTEFVPVTCTSPADPGRLNLRVPKVRCDLRSGASGSALLIGDGDAGQDLAPGTVVRLAGVLSTYSDQGNEFAPASAVVELVDQLGEGRRWLHHPHPTTA